VPDGAADRDAFEWRPGTRAAQEQAAPAHVAAAGERGGEEQAVAKDVEERAHVLVGGDAAEQDDLVVGCQSAVQRGRIPYQGAANAGSASSTGTVAIFGDRRHESARRPEGGRAPAR